MTHGARNTLHICLDTPATLDDAGYRSLKFGVGSEIISLNDPKHKKQKRVGSYDMGNLNVNVHFAKDEFIAKLEDAMLSDKLVSFMVEMTNDALAFLGKVVMVSYDSPSPVATIEIEVDSFILDIKK